MLISTLLLDVQYIMPNITQVPQMIADYETIISRGEGVYFVSLPLCRHFMLGCPALSCSLLQKNFMSTEMICKTVVLKTNWFGESQHTSRPTSALQKTDDHNSEHSYVLRLAVSFLCKCPPGKNYNSNSGHFCGLATDPYLMYWPEKQETFLWLYSAIPRWINW